MNETNLKYLEDQIFYTNFGRGHSEALKEKLREGRPEFTLTHQQDFGKDSTVATLHFKKSNESDKYFFNSYDLTLKVAGGNEIANQTFYLNNDPKKKEHEDITLKEGYNLLSGRAVNKNLVSKDGQTYNAWVQLDFKSSNERGNFEEKKYHQNYGYDIEKVLAKYPIKELADEELKSRLLDSLKRGNRQGVAFEINGKETRVYIEASPQYKGINFYDSHMQRVTPQALMESAGEAKSENKAAAKSSNAKQEASDGEDGPAGGSKSNKQKKGQRIS